MSTRRLAYEPRATVSAAVTFAALSLSTLRGIDLLVLVGLLAYVALSTYLPRPAAFRDSASRYL